MYTGFRFRFEHKSLRFSETFEVFLVFFCKFLFIISGMRDRAWRITTGLINQIGRLMDFPVKKHFHNFFPHRVQLLKVGVKS